LVLVSNELDQLKRLAEQLVEAKPDVIFCGGGDGAATALYNTLRQLTDDVPPLGLLRMGTGNAWAGTLGARAYSATLTFLAAHPQPLPVTELQLVEVEGVACPFAGVGWDARILGDYQRERDRLSGRMFVSPLQRWLHSGLTGYLYSTARYTVPAEWWRQRTGGGVATLEQSEGCAHRRNSDGDIVSAAEERLFDGPVGVAGFSTITDYGFGLRAFPLARAVPGHVNIRLYSGPVLDAVKNAVRIWRGSTGVTALHDYFVTCARLQCSEPLPFQIAGDSAGERTSVEIRVADRPARLIDWHAAFAEA
jgi:diacylglycerol kinase family enzyme